MPQHLLVTPCICQPCHAPPLNSALHPICSASHASGALLAPLGLKVTILLKYLGVSELVQLVGLEHQPALALGEGLALLVSVLRPCSKGRRHAWRMSWSCMSDGPAGESSGRMHLFATILPGRSALHAMLLTVMFYCSMPCMHASHSLGCMGTTPPCRCPPAHATWRYLPVHALPP